MNPELAAARFNRAVVVSIIVAAVAVTACALVGIAVMLGWLAPKSSVSTPVSLASPGPGQKAAGTAPGVDLVPGETLVTPPEALQARPGPVAPDYSRPPAAKPAPLASSQPPSSKPEPLASAPRKPAPSPPSYAKPRVDALCVNCGSIAAITTYPDSWEVRVRFEDGTTRSVRYDTQPPLRLGDRVRLENGRLNRY